MPEIPRPTSTFVPEGPKVSPGPLKELGAKMQQATEQVWGSLEKIEKSTKALYAVRLENQMHDKASEIAESYVGRTDPENFDKDLEKQIQSFDELRPKFPDPDLNLAFQKVRGHYSGQLSNVVMAKKITVMGDLGKIEANKLVSDTLSEYNAAGEEERPLIKRDFEKKMDVLRNNWLMNPLWIDEHKRGLTGAADMMRARQDALRDPIGTFEKLQDLKKNYPDLDPLKQPELIEHTISLVRMQETIKRQQEQDIKNQFNEIKSSYKTRIFWDISKKKDVSALMDAGMQTGLLDASIISEVDSFQRRMLTADEKEEDPIIKQKLIQGTYGSGLTVSEDDLMKAVSNGINVNTYQTLLAHRTQRIETDRKEAKSEAKQRLDKAFEHNEKALNMKFTMEGPGAAIIDREAKSLHGDALREYRGLVYDNNVDPDTAVDTVINRYGRVLDGIKDRESKKLRRALIMPNRETVSIDEMVMWLDKNKPNMPNATYQAQIRMIRDIEGLESKPVEKPQPTTEQKKRKYKIKEQ